MSNGRIKNSQSAMGLLLAFLLVGCGPQSKFNNATSLEKKGRPYEAWQAYQEFAAENPGHALAAEALFRAGWLAQRKVGDCAMAAVFYDQVLEQYPQSEPWAQAALLRKNNCPDYFPLMPGAHWVEGDSETKGKNARIEIESLAKDKKEAFLSGDSGRLRKTYFAGDKKFESKELFYRKQDLELHESLSENDPQSKIILKWPLEVGTRWSTKWQKQLFHFTITGIDKTITVVAGEFQHCLEVTSSIEGTAGNRTDIYAPGVGHILTLQSSRNQEIRITELLSFKSPDDLNEPLEEKKK
jgi:tetratricopeptide (TPR) repeat protein